MLVDGQIVELLSASNLKMEDLFSVFENAGASEATQESKKDDGKEVAKLPKDDPWVPSLVFKHFTFNTLHIKCQNLLLSVHWIVKTHYYFKLDFSKLNGFVRYTD